MPAAQCQVNKTDMPIKPIASRTHVRPHLKRVGLCAGALAVVYAAVQEHDHVVGQIANVQHMLTQNGLTLMQKLWEVADASLAKVHETFIAAAPPTNLEAAVRHGLIGRPEDTVPRGRAKASAIRVRESDANADDEDGDDPPLEEKTGHRTRRARHSGPEQNAAPSQHRCSSRAAGANTNSDGRTSPWTQEAGGCNPTATEEQNDKAASAAVPTSGESKIAAEAKPAADEPKTLEAVAMAAAADPAVDEPKALEAVAMQPKTLEAVHTSIAQRAQADPAGLLGARLSSTWVDETFTCEVIMIREGQGGKFEALVKYETDNVEQWEALGEPPYMHVIVTEPAEAWLRTGSALIGARTLGRIDPHECEGIVMAWLPKRDDSVALYKVYHTADGDFEELDEAEVHASVDLYKRAHCQLSQRGVPSDTADGMANGSNDASCHVAE